MPAAAAKPSIVLIITDDMEVGLVEHMPKVKSLIAGQGATFTRAYFNNPLCCPSRVTMLTGRYSHNTRVTSNKHAQFYKSGLTGKTSAVWLKGVGYRTALIGKYLTEYPKPAPATYIPPGWDHWEARMDSGGGEQYGYTLNENGKTVKYGSSPGDYATDVFKGKALAFVQEAVSDGVPFYLELGLNAPHRPSTPAPRHEKLFATLKAPRTPSFNEADVSDKPSYIRTKGLLSAGGINAIDNEYRLRARSLQAVDELVEALVKALDTADRLNDTYILFTSDNGWLMGPHRVRGAKGQPYEESLRMPLYVRGPGIKAGLVLQHLVGNVDLAPTFAEWAGLAAPKDIDGRSFAPVLKAGGPGAEAWRHAYPIRFVARQGVPTWNGVRTRDYTYVEYATGERELYEVDADPFQLENQASLASNKALIAELSKRTATLKSCKAAACRNAENDPL